MFRIDPARLTCDRDQFAAALDAEGCACWVGYIETPMYRYPLFERESFFAGRWPVKELGLTTMDYSTVSLPETEAICRTAVHVTIRENLTPEYIEQSAEAIAKVAAHYRT